VRPLGEREILIGYRARRLSHQYGVLGYEKYKIGIEMKRLAKHRGLNVDIEVESEHRIYGNAWYRFLGSCHATLGTESGSNVFDEDNTIARLAARYANLAFEDFSQRFLGPLDGWVHMNQIAQSVRGHKTENGTHPIRRRVLRYYSASSSLHSTGQGLFKR
jgi:hypothetical protein